jgi:hypothetical protein
MDLDVCVAFVFFELSFKIIFLSLTIRNAGIRVIRTKSSGNEKYLWEVVTSHVNSFLNHRNMVINFALELKAQAIILLNYQ